jgi:Trp operon repressor
MWCQFVLTEAWQKILDKIAKQRQQHDMVKLHSLLLTGEELFGLLDATVLRIIESVSFGSFFLSSLH